MTLKAGAGSCGDYLELGGNTILYLTIRLKEEFGSLCAQPESTA